MTASAHGGLTRAAAPGVLALGLITALAAPATAGARAPAPRIRAVDCWPRRCAPLRVAVGGSMSIAADRLGSRNYVLFPVGRGRTRAVRARRASSRQLVVRVPPNAVSGRLRVRAPGRSASRASRWVTITRRRSAGPPPRADASAFGGNGMWIWVLSRSDGGDLPTIVARARAANLRTVYVKAADGTSVWSQFSSDLVARLKGAGLRVCAWQYVYGDNPGGEAAAAASAIARGADCFVIDAEAEFEGRYAQAQTYVQALRSRVGAAYPLALSSFPYVDYHPSFPYSVFLGPGAAQANLPQMYWKAIGTSVDEVYAHTWPLNRAYGAPIYPVGQTYQSPSAGEIGRFRSLAPAYGAGGLSWWDWQETSGAGWSALGAPVASAAAPPAASAWPTLAQGSRGDLVVWAQEHLRGAGYNVTADGAFGSATRGAVLQFQAASGLPQTGRVDAATWPALLRAPTAQARWASTSGARSAGAGGAAGARPASATGHAARNEIPILGRGG